MGYKDDEEKRKRYAHVIAPAVSPTIVYRDTPQKNTSNYVSPLRNQGGSTYEPEITTAGQINQRMYEQQESADPKSFDTAAAQGDWATRNMSDADKKTYDLFLQYQKQAEYVSQKNGRPTVDPNAGWNEFGAFDPMAAMQQDESLGAYSRAQKLKEDYKKQTGISEREFQNMAKAREASTANIVTAKDAASWSPETRDLLEQLAYKNRDVNVKRKDEQGIKLGALELDTGAMQEYKELYDQLGEGWNAERIKNATEYLRRTPEEQRAHAQRNINSLDQNQRDMLNQIMEYDSGNYGGVNRAGIANGITKKDRDATYQALTESLGGDADETERLLQYAGELQDYERRVEQQERIRKNVTGDNALGYGVLYSAADVITSPVSGFGGIVETVKSKRYADPLAPVNTNSELYALSNFGADTEQAISENLREKYGEGAAFLYGVAMSSSKSVYSAALGSGVGKALSSVGNMSEGALRFAQHATTLPSFGAGAYSQTLEEAQERGITGNDAILTATVSGIAEMATEVCSLDKIWDIAQAKGVRAAKSMIVDSLVQAGIEGSEEVASDIINLVADGLINGDKSKYNQTVKELMDNGASEEEARKAATLETLKEMGTDFLAGAASGGSSAVGGNVIRTVRNTETAKQMTADGNYTGIVAQLQGSEAMQLDDQINELEAKKESQGLTKKEQEALTQYTDSRNAAQEAIELGRELEQKQKNGEKISTKEKRHLIELIQDAGAEQQVQEYTEGKRVTAENIAQEDYADLTTTLTDMADSYQDEAARASITQAAELSAELAEKADAGEKITKKEQKQLANLINEANNAEGVQESRGEGSSASAETIQKINDRLNERNQIDVKERNNTEEITEVPEEYKSGSNVSLSEGIAAMQKAETPAQLGKAYNDMLNSSDMQARDAAEAQYKLYSGRMLVEGNATADEMALGRQSREMAYLAGVNGVQQDTFAGTEQEQAYKAGQLERYQKYAKSTIDKGTQIKDAPATTNKNKDVTLGEFVASGRDAKIRTSNGVMNLSNVTANNDSVARLYSNAATMESAAAANSYIDMYPAGVPVERYNAAFKHLYTQGRLGTPFKTAFENKFNMEGVLDRIAAKRIYDLGANATQQETRKPAEVTRKGSGNVTVENGAKIQKAQLRLIKDLAKAAGVDVTIRANIESGENANIDLAESIIEINSKSKMNKAALMLHELGHFMQTHNGEKYNQFQDAFIQYLVDVHGAEYVTNALENYMAAYTEVEGNKTVTDAREEFINDALGGLLLTEEGVNEFAEYLEKNMPEAERKSVLRTLGEFLQSLVDRIKEALSSGEFTQAARRTARLRADQLSDLSAKLFETLQGARENYDSLTPAQQVEQYVKEHGRTGKDFSLKDPLEQTDRLIAVHNMKEMALLEDLRLGGLPSPSIAIVRAGMAHTEFGPISLLFNRDTVDPQADRRNKVYGGDAWTPTFPTVEYKLNNKAAYELQNKIKDLAKDFSDGVFSEDASNSVGRLGLIYDEAADLSEQHYIDRLADNDGVMAAYLAETNPSVEIEKQYAEKQYDNVLNNERLREFSDALGEDTVLRFADELKSADDMTKEYESAVIDALYKISDEGSFLRRYIDRKLDLTKAYGIVQHAAEQIRANGNDKTTSLDKLAMSNDMRSKIDQNDFRNWIAQQLDGVLGERGVRNAEDPFTSSGNRKSFERLHYAYTLENIVRAMQEGQAERGESAALTGAGLRSITTPSYSDIESARADADRLATFKEKEGFENVVTTDIQELVSDIDNTNKDSGYGSYMNQEIIEELLMQSARGKRSVQGIMDLFAKESELSITEEQAKRALSIFNEASKLPVEYFEAKPQRAVYNNEIAAAVIPDNSSDTLREQLAANNIRTVEYKAGDESSRIDAINGIDDVKFSLQVDSEGRNLSEVQHEYASAAENVVQHDYSYDTLTSKNPIALHSLGDYGLIIESDPVVSRTQLLEDTKKNIEKYNKKVGRPELGDTLLVNQDLGALVRVGRKAIEHYSGKRHGKINDINIIPSLPLYMENAIVVNTADPARREYDFSYVLIGAYYDNNELKIARMIVNHAADEYILNGIEEFSLSSYTAKKEGVATSATWPSSQNGTGATPSEISIGDLLDIVKNTYPDILSLDVAKNVGVTTTKSDIRGLRHSLEMDDFFDIFSGENDTSLSETDFLPDGTEQTTDYKQQSVDNAVSILEEGGRILYEQYMRNADPVATERTVRSIARNILSDYQSDYDQATLADNLQKAFAYMQQNEGVNYSDMLQLISEIAQPVLEQSKDTLVGSEVYNAFRDSLRGKEVRLNKQQKAEVAYTFGSYAAFKNAMRGVLKFNDKATDTLDMVWDEIVSQSQGVLDYDVSDAQMPIALADAVDSMRPTKASEWGGNRSDMAYDMALDIVQQYFGAQQDTQAKAQLTKLRDKLKNEKAAYRKKVQERYNERLAKAREELKAKRDLWKDKYHDNIRLRDEKIAQIKAQNRQNLVERRNRQEAAKEREQIRKVGKDLIDMLNNPTDQKHVPQGMRKPIAQFLSAIDFLPARAQENSGPTKSWQERMRSLQNILNQAERGELTDNELGALAFTLDEDIAATLDNFLARNENTVSIADLDYESVHDLRQMMYAIRAAISNADKALASAKGETISQLANGTMEELATRKRKDKNRTKAGRLFHNLLNLHNLDSFTYAHMLGKDAESLMNNINEGWYRMVSHVQDAGKAFENMRGSIKAKDMKAWTSDRRDFKGVDGTVSLSQANIMELYMLMQDEDARRHLQLGGVKVDEYSKKGVVHEQKTPVHFTRQQFKDMFATLSDEQRALAENMQQYMAKEVGKWGNRTTMLRNGYEKFTNDNYYPIRVDKTTVAVTGKTEANKNAGVSSLKNSGFTKQRVQNANNALIIGDIFSTFSRHIQNMAAYDGLVIPVEDAMKWFNYKTIETVTENGSKFKRTHTIQEEIQKIMGKGGTDYFTKLMSDINGVNMSDTVGEMSNALLSNFKKASVMGNIRVAAQQPTAYLRALAVIDGKYLAKALPSAVNPVMLKKYAAKANENSPLAYWKSQGYYDVHMGRSFESMITGISSFSDKMGEVGGLLAQKGDEYTWGMLWKASEEKNKAEFKKAGKQWYTMEDGKRVDTPEFIEATKKTFHEIINRTQVIDSPLHRSAMMRGKGLVQLATSFFAEPTKSYNMVRRALFDAVEHGDYKALTRSVVTFGLTALLTSAVASAIDAFRYKKDDDKEWLERWWDSMFGIDKEKGFLKNILPFLTSTAGENLNILNTIPYVKDVTSVLSGFDSQRSDIAGIENLTSAIMDTIKAMNGESKKSPYGLVKSISQGASQVTGVPAYAWLREFETLWNNIGGFFGAESLKTTMGTTRQQEYGKLYKAIKKDEGIELATKQMVLDGKTVKDIQEALTAEYKDKYLEAEDRGPIADKIAKALTTMGFTDEDANNFILSWEEEKATYKAIDDAMESGENIAEAAKESIESGKDPKNLMKHLGGAYAATLKLLDEWSTEMADDLQADLIEALDAAGIEDAKSVVEGWRGGSSFGTNVSDYKDLQDAIGQGSPDTIKEKVKQLQDMGKENKTIQTQITGLIKSNLYPLTKTDLSAANDYKRDLISAYMSIGLSHEEANKKINKRLKDLEKEEGQG